MKKDKAGRDIHMRRDLGMKKSADISLVVQSELNEGYMKERKRRQGSGHRLN